MPWQYQVRLHHYASDGNDLIYAPLDEDRYIRRAAARPTPCTDTVQVEQRLSQERRLIRVLEDSLNKSPDERMRSLYEKTRARHKKAVRRIIADIT